MENYRLQTSAKRLFRKNQGMVSLLSTPSLSEESYRLYKKHKKRFEESGNDTYERYAESFFSPLYGNMQLSIQSNNTLVSVLHLDITPLSLSAVYCYYDDEYKLQSLGTYAISKAIEIAINRGIKWFYLGYLVKENRHMSYKDRFRPSQIRILQGWVPYMDKTGLTVDPEAFHRGFQGKELRETERELTNSSAGFTAG